MNLIKLTINDQNVQAAKVITVNGTTKLIECEFMFNDHWDAFPAKTAIFKNNNMADSYETVIVNNKCVVPHEALKKDGVIRLAIKGSNTDNQTERTETIDVICQNKTLQGGINAIDPTPDQYAQYVEAVGEAITEYFDEHKSEFKGDKGDKGDDGDDYILTDADKVEISNLTFEELKPIIESKMEFYKLDTEVSGTAVTFYHDGEQLDYQAISDKYFDNKYFLYAECLNLTFIPCFPPTETDQAIEFISTYIYGGDVMVDRLNINSNNEGKFEEKYIAEKSDIPDPYDDTEIKAELNDVKENLNDKVGKEDYATSSNGGVVVINTSADLEALSNGAFRGVVRTPESFATRPNTALVSKGTLENVLNIEREKLADTQNALLQAERKIDLLYALNEGISYVWETDETEAHSKQIPSGAKQMGVEMIGGKSLVWNQLVKQGYLYSSDGLQNITDNNDGSYTVTSGANAYYQPYRDHSINIVSGHKYYAKLKNGIESVLYLRVDTMSGSVWINGSNTPSIYTADFTASRLIYIRAYGYSGNTVTITPTLIDLTQMFGAGNEPTSVDDPRIKAIEEYALAHPEYNEGEIISSQTDEVVVRGKNLIDIAKSESGGIDSTGTLVAGVQLWRGTEYIDALPNTAYTISGGYTSIYRIYEYDSNKKYLGRTEFTPLTYETYVKNAFTTKSNTAYLKWTINNSNGVDRVFAESLNILLEKGSTATPYTPYIPPQTIPTNFPQLNSAGTVYDYVDVDKGELHRRVGVVDLGTLNWKVGVNNTFYATLSDSDKEDFPVLCVAYTQNNKGASSLGDKEISTFGSSGFYEVRIRDTTFSTISDVTTALSGKTLYYELAEEVVTPIDLPTELTDAISVEGNGSITFVDHNGHNFIIPNRETYMVKVGEA